MVRLGGLEPPTSGATNLRSEEIDPLPTHSGMSLNYINITPNTLSTLTFVNTEIPF